MKQNWLACRHGSISSSRSTRHWEKLSGSCTPGARKSPTPPRRRAIRTIPATPKTNLVAELTPRERISTSGAGDGRLVAFDVALPVTPSDTGDRSASPRVGLTSRISPGRRAVITQRSPPAGRWAIRWITRLPATWDDGDDACLTALLVAHCGNDRRSKRTSGHAEAVGPPRHPGMLRYSKLLGPGRFGAGTSPTYAPRGVASRSRRTRSSTSTPA